ncbi:MAG TPA: chemotaxis response regulator protein-glutamate methylesterase [Candidatus Acidoferrum sp.]|nr:chemotaxis response regulator protein-glutamate methylesterase [Candidatus Acidoferrum sp.]
MLSEDSASRQITVLVVDDSAVVRQVLEAVLSQEPDLVVMVAADPLIAQRKMARIRPDVIVLDLEMPRMDGLAFLRKVMATDPIPTVICSGVAGRGTQAALRALEEGAVGIVTKPKLGLRDFLYESGLVLTDMVRAAARARISRPFFPSDLTMRKSASPQPRHQRPDVATRRIVAIGASTGGTEALTEILTAMPKDSPGIAVVQHMPEVFTAAFAERLNQLSQIEVKEAEHGDLISPGRALIAPGNRHMSVRRRGEQVLVEIADGPLISRHRPSVDVLFRSVAQAAGANGLGIILTGMGNDGAQGLLEMKKSGAETVAQDEASCVVFGMPREAIACGAVDFVLPLSKIPAKISL